MSTDNTSPLLEFGGFTIPAGCRRIFITAELESCGTNAPVIQPTGFPDIGPVLYPDPAGVHGLICLIESEASMANWLESVCFETLRKHEGTLKAAFQGLPYLRAEQAGQLKTASTLDGHRFASDFLATCTAKFAGEQQQSLAEFIKTSLGMTDGGKSMPIADVPNIFPLVLGLDTMSLIHGFQVSNKQITFVGLRLPRALTASVVGINCERLSIPGVKFNAGQLESDSGQAIFQKSRITAKKIEARFSIDVGLLTSLRLVASGEQLPDGVTAEHLQINRSRLLLAVALWKVAAFLDLLSVELSLRTECKLRLKRGSDGQPLVVSAACEGGPAPSSPAFDFSTIAATSLAADSGVISGAHLPGGRSPLTLQFA